MTTYFVSRHPGACQWLREEGIGVDQMVPHFEPAIVQPGDTVIGSLPVNLAADVCARGGRYLQLSMSVPPELRGVELSVQQMRACGARLEEYAVRRVARTERLTQNGRA